MKIKKKIGKLFIVFISAITLLTSLNIIKIVDVHAAPTIEKNYRSYWYVNGGSDNGFEIRINGNQAYCVQPYEHLDPTANYNQVGYNEVGLTADQANTVQLISYYGFGYLGRTDAGWEQITQTAIWRYLGADKYITSTLPSQSYMATRGQVLALVDEIMNDVNKFDIAPSFDNTTITLVAGEIYTYTDTNNVLTDYDVIATGGLEIVSKSGNTLTVKATQSSDDNATIMFQRNMTKNAKAQDTQFYYYNSYSQNLMLASKGDPKYAKAYIKVQKTGFLDISKVNENQDLIDGSKFQVIGTNYNETVTVTNGHLNLELNLGTYTVQEVDAPEGYLIDDTIYNVTINAGETSYISNNGTNTFVNNEPRGSITLTKTNSNGNVVAGAEYGLYAKTPIRNKAGTRTYANANALVNSGVTDSNGQIIFTDLHLGDYYIKEIKAPDGYLLDENIYDVTLAYADEVTNIITANVKSVEKEPTGTLTGLKVDSETGNVSQGDAVLGGATYGLIAVEDNYNTNGTVLYNKTGDIIARTVTDANGIMKTITNIPMGKYILKELNPSTGYLLDTTEYPVNITYEGQNVSIISRSVTSYEDIIKGKIRIFKTGTIGLPGMLGGLANAEFTLKLHSEVANVGWDNAYTYDVLTTDLNGFAESKDLPYGVYIIRETSVPENYIGSPDILVDINVHNEVEFKAINNRPFQSWLKLVKIDGHGNSIILSNATFKLYTLDSEGNKVYLTQKVGDKYVTEFTTNSEGYIQLPYVVDVDTYYIEELVTPEGFLTSEDIEVIVSSTNPNITIDEDGEPVITVNIVNEAPTGTIELTKNFESFEVNNEITNAIDVVAKFRLYANSDVISSTDGSIIYNNNDEIPNADSEDGTYSIRDGETLVIEGLPMGTDKVSYKLVEVETAEGYVLDETEIIFDFEIEDHITKTYTVSDEMENKLIRTDIELAKTDLYTGDIITGLSNFEFTAYTDEECTQVYEVSKVNPETGIATFSDVSYGMTLYIRETSTNDTYYLSDELFVVTVDKNLEGIGDVYTFNYDNRPIPTLATEATGINEQKVFDTNVDNTMTDIITYTNVDVTKVYTLVTQLINKNTGEIISSLVTEDIAFETKDGEYVITMNIPAHSIKEDGDYYFAEFLYFNDQDIEVDEPIAEHNDEKDKGQTVTFETSKIGTLATGINGEKEFNIEIDNTILDTIAYENVDNNKTYTIVSEFVRKVTVEMTDVDTSEVIIVERDEVITREVIEDIVFEDKSGEYIVTLEIPAWTLSETGEYYFREYLFEAGKDIEIDEPVTYHNDREDEGQTIIFKEVNTIIQARKVDSLDATKVLKQAEFTLYDTDMEVLKVLETDENGLVIFENIKYGKYFLKETKAPVGYKLSDEVIEIVIDENYDKDHIYEVTVQNTFFPFITTVTGDNSNILLFVSIGSFALLGLVYLSIKKKQDKDEETSKIK